MRWNDLPIPSSFFPVALLLTIALALTACGGTDAPDAEAAGNDEGPEVAADTDDADDTPDDEGPGDDEDPAEEESVPDQETTSITFMLPSDNPLQYYPVFIAEDLGYYAEEGLDVTIEDVGGSSAVIQQIIAGNADIAMPSPPAYLNAVSRDEDVYFFYQMHYTNVFDLIAPDGGPVSAPEDLEGQTIGVTELAGGEVPFVRAVLGDVGLTEGTDYEVVPVGDGGALTLNAIQSDEVQAYAASIYDIAALNVAGQPTTSIMPEEYKAYPANGFAVTGEVLNNNHDVLVSFLRAVNKATVFGQANPEAALELSTKDRPDLYDDPEIVDAFWETTLAMMTPPDPVADEPIGAMYRDGWQGFHDFMVASPEDEGGLPEEVDLEHYLAFDPLEDAMDFDIAEIEAQAADYN